MEIGIPDGIKKSTSGVEVILSRRWASWSLLFTMAFSVFWIGFLVFWYLTAFKTDDLVAKLFPILHVGVGFWLVYSVLIGLINKTLVTLKPGSLQIYHGPIPNQRNRKLQSVDIKQLYVKERSSSNNKGGTKYDVLAILKSGKNMTLIKGLSDSDQAIYFEQEIEKYHNIKDESVKGEYAGGN